VTAYCDSSVLARFVLDQPDQLTELDADGDLVTSVLSQVECLRAVENARLRGELTDADCYLRRREVYTKLAGLRRVGLTHSVLRRAGEPIGLPLKALDAIHLATALLVRERGAPDLTFATHDRQQGRAALALGFEVLGI
jgi:predicted nucleic acid-binding protein